MTQRPAFHAVTVGWSLVLLDVLGKPLAARSRQRWSHIVHPRHSAAEFRREDAARHHFYFFRDDPREPLPSADHDLLASLEREGIPTVHNMIFGDRVVSALPYYEALGYANFLARRLTHLFDELRPSVVIAGFDALHSGISLAVARRLGIPWFAMNFSVIPPGLACFCRGMSPGTRVQIGEVDSPGELAALAQTSLENFETGRLRAPAYIEPPTPSLSEAMARMPAKFSAVLRTIRNARRRQWLRFTDSPGRHSVAEAVSRMRRAAAARKAATAVHALTTPPATPYVLFGLHRQPEASIDVWAPFFSNQMWIIELLARSLPPTHRLLVKIHKSDVSNYSSEQYRRMRALPGVELVAPLADGRTFIDRADLVFAIQGTMGLEAALLGKPVILLGDSPVAVFPSASLMTEIQALPALIRSKLSEPRPAREQILKAYASYLAPFAPAAHNNWNRELTDQEIERFVRLFDRLEVHLSSTPARAEASA